MTKDWLDISKYQARRLNPFTGNWDPANWDISRINFDAIVEAAEAVVIRLGDGLNLDPCFTRFRAELERRGAVWAIYHLHRPNISAIEQVAFILDHQTTLPPAGVLPDLEVNAGYTGEAYFARTDPYLRGLDEGYGRVCDIYSAQWFLDGILSATIQRRWAFRDGWWASYPALRIPAGWAAVDPPYALHQYTNRKVWPGLPNPADASYRNPQVPLEAMLITPPSPTIPGGDVGTRIGIHAISPAQAIPLLRTLRDQGAKVASILAVEQAGILLDAKDISPGTVRILRLFTPQFDGLQDIGTASPGDLMLTANSFTTYVAGRLTHLSQAERDAINLLAVLNEADPPTLQGWRNYGALCRLLCEWATSQGVRLLLPGWNNGTPEYAEVVQFFRDGLAEAMVAGGHALNIHEGVHPPDNQGPIILDPHLPGAPFPVPGAGTLALRYRHTVDHLRRTGHPVPDIYVGEFYGGAYGAENMTTTLANFMFYDQEVRQEPWLRAFHGFTMDPGPGWSFQDYNPLMTSPGMVGYIVQERERANPTTPPPAPDIIPGGTMAQYLITVPNTITAGDLRQRIGPVDILDLRIVVQTDNIPDPPKWFESWPMGPLEPPRTLANPNAIITFYRRDGLPFSPQPLLNAQGQPRAVTWEMQATEHILVGGLDLLRVLDLAGDANDWYVRAVDVLPKA